MKFIKKDIIERMAKNESLTKKEAELRINQVLNTLVDLSQDLEKEGDSINITEYFSLTFKHRKAREGRNPRTKEVINIPAKNVIVAKLGKKFDVK